MEYVVEGGEEVKKIIEIYKSMVSINCIAMTSVSIFLLPILCIKNNARQKSNISHPAILHESYGKHINMQAMINLDKEYIVSM